MLIRVIYHDYRFDFVKPFLLDRELLLGRISMFRRRSGWVFVGIDPVRENRKNRRAGSFDRRQPRFERPH